MSAPEPPTRQQGEEQALEKTIGGDLPGGGYLFPDGTQDPRPAPDIADVRNELLRAIKTLALMVQLPYGEDKKADVGHCILALGQTYLLTDPTLDNEGVPVEGPGSKAHAQALATHEFPPRVQPNPAEERLNERTKPEQEALKHDRGQAPLPRPRANG